MIEPETAARGPVLATAVPITEAGAETGEGPRWDAAVGILWWVDVDGGKVHRFDPASHANTTIDLGTVVGAVNPRTHGGLVVAVDLRVALLDWETGALEPIASLEPGPTPSRVNDAACDPAGRLWVGTCAADWQPNPRSGSLYRVDPDGTTTRAIPDVTLSNGLAWRPDGTELFYVDTPTQRIDAYRADPATGELGPRRTVAVIPEAAGMPDGLTLDAEGMLWLGLWGGGAVWRIDPADGRCVGIVEVPTPNVTACAFGGPGLDDLYITTAREAGSPLGGALFHARVGVSGLPAYAFAG